jgi:hypothetical protein
VIANQARDPMRDRVPAMVATGRRKSYRAAGWWAGLVVAALAVLLWNGNPQMLNPADITWIDADDPFQHVMGWEQFRGSPLLQYPITKNEGYGLERGSALVYSDAIPIAALVLRPFSPILPRPFQYLGWWAVLSLVLQGYWAARLIRLRTDRTAVIALGAGFLMVAPVLLNRIGIHTALTSQWTILCALWLYFSSSEPRARRWALLLLLAISIHAYLFVMVGAIWAANLVKCRIARTLTRRDLLHAGATVIAVATWMHALGYFLVGRGAAAGGGNSRIDLVNFVCGISWSTLLPDVKGNLDPNAWDGYAYLGVGLLGLLVGSAVVRIVRRVRGGGSRETSPGVEASSPVAAPDRVAVSWIPLIVVAAGFLVFAVSNHVLFGGDEILTYPWPGFMRTVTATFRGQGRMIWPTYYVLVLAILWFVIRTWRPRTLAYLLAAGLVLQVIDFREGARLMRVGTSGSGLVKPLRDPIWATVATRYRKLVSIPAFHGQPDRHTLAWFSARNGLGSNIGYFSRMNPRRQQQGAERALEEVLSAHYDPETVYYFPHAETWNIAKLTASPHDLALVADGHHLLVPGGNPAGTARPDDVVVPPLGTELSFAASGTGQGLLLDGWSWREAWGTWSDSKTPSFLLPLPRGYRGKLRIVLRWLGHAAPGVRQSAIIRFDDAEFTVGFAADAVPQDSTFDVVATHDWIAVRIRIRRPVVEVDGRLLGVGLIAVRMTNPDARAPDAPGAHPPP